MEAAAATAFAGRIAPMLLEFLQANLHLRRNLTHDIEYIKSEFSMISAVIQEDDADGGPVRRAWIHMIRDLAQAIEDCIDRFTHRVKMPETPSLSDHVPPWIRRYVHWVKTVKARTEFAAAIRELKKISQDLFELRRKYCNNSGIIPPATAGTTSSSDDDNLLLLARSPVGMDAARDELLELMTNHHHHHQVKVISIVGFNGIGKTFLAKHVYDAIKSQYESHAWVGAATAAKGAVDVVREIHRQINHHLPEEPTTNGGLSLSKLRESVRDFLKLGTKRFFIVIDDMQTPFWHQISDAFDGLVGIVVVTTAIRSVATACSTSALDDHVYAMAPLADQDSRWLFFNEAFHGGRDSSPPLAANNAAISEAAVALKKCDGLPLALVTTGQFLLSREHTEWEQLCDDLGEHLETAVMLARMKRVLVNSYTSISSQDVRTCLLYLGIYPIASPARRGSLVRRWLAEGFIQGGHKRRAMGIFEDLVDRSIIIQPAGRHGNNRSAQLKKRCRTHGMMLEFILRKSISDNFITLLRDDDQPTPATTPLALMSSSEIRWLSLHHATDTQVAGDLSLVRSLTVFGKAHKSVFVFSKYQLLRVLDLEECDDGQMEDKHLRDICTKLLLLRYLSLGAALNVTLLPKEINKLQLLETLDLRRTSIEILPIEAMELPCLIHLFGKFKLQHQAVGGRRMRKLQNFLSKHSKLETVAGFVVDSNNSKSQGFAHLMEHIKHLTKVKIWCAGSADFVGDNNNNNNNNNNSHFSEAIKAFIKTSTRLKEARSLALNFNDQCFQDILLNLSLDLEKGQVRSYYLRSLKLHGSNRICSLPPFVKMLAGLTKLCLSSPHLQLSVDIVTALGELPGLANLKLVATILDKLEIKDGAFQYLRCLCLVVKFMAELEIPEGAMPFLGSLQLLCKDLNGFGRTTIQSLPRIKEVVLHDGVSQDKKHEWKEAGKNHPRCPKVWFVTMDEAEVDVESELAENYSRSPAAPPTADSSNLSVTTPDHATTSTELSVQIVSSETVDDKVGSEPGVEIHVAPGAVDNTTLSGNHDDAVTNGKQEYPAVQVATC